MISYIEKQGSGAATFIPEGNQTMPLKIQWDTYGSPASALTQQSTIISIIKTGTENSNSTGPHCKNRIERKRFCQWR